MADEKSTVGTATRLPGGDRRESTGSQTAILALDPLGTILVSSQHTETLIGYPVGELTGKSISVLLDDDGRRAGLFDNGMASAAMSGSSEFEATLARSDGGSFPASVAMISTKGPHSEISGFAVAIGDLSRRRAAREALRHARDRFESIMDNSPLMAIQGFDSKGIIRYWNKASEELYGYPAADAVGNRAQDVMLEAGEAECFTRELSLVREKGVARQPREWNVKSRSGAAMKIFSTMFPIIEDGKVVEVFCLDVGVGERSRAEERFERLSRLYSLLRKAGEATVRNRDIQKMYEQVCRIAVEDGLFRMAWVGLVDQETQTVVPAASWGTAADVYLDNIRISVLEVPDGIGPGGTAVREGHYCVCNDIASDPIMANWKDKALKQGFRSNAAFPLRVGNQVIGIINFYSSEPGQFDEEQVKLLESLAGDMSFAIESLDREERRKQAEKALRESERYYRSLIDNALDVITVLNSDGTVGYTSPSITRVLGYKRSEVRGRSILELVHTEDRARTVEKLDEVMRAAGGSMEGEFRVLHKDGSFRTLELFGWSYSEDSGSVGVVLNARDVTMRKAMEESLKKSEETQHAMLDALPDWAALVDTRGKILAINQAGADSVHEKAEELIGQSMSDVMAGMTGYIWELAGEVIRTGRPKRVETETDGRYYEINMQPVLDEDGKVTTLAVVSHDMTSYKQAEMAQRKDQDFVSTVINTTGALVLVLDSDGSVILFNSTCEHVTGFSFDEIRGRYVWDVLIAPEEREDDRAQFEMVLEGKLLPNYENHVLTRHGGRKLISWSNTTVFEEDGNVGYVIKTGIDVTERRKAEKALKQSEEQYRMMFESTGTAMCIIDDSAKVTFLNKEFERMTGYVAEEVEEVMLLTDFLLPDDVPGFEAYFRESRAVRRNVPLHFECRIVDKMSNRVSVLANMGVIPGGDASVVSLIDVSREKSYEQDLQETAERLRHFLTVASHELRHPITIVKGYANTLTAYMENMPRELIMEILDDINSSTDRLTRYVEELMDVSRVEEGRFLVDRRAIEPMELMRMAEEDMQVLGSPNEFSFHVVPGTGAVDVDPEKFVQLLVILLDNAVKFSEPGTPVEVQVGREGGSIVVSVMDRGIGLHDEDMGKVFDRFYQVEDALHHSKQGIGLGLYIAREIVSGHSGKIWCEARPGGGTIFRFILPQ